METTERQKDDAAPRPVADGRFVDGELDEIRAAFAPRLRDAFENASNAEIARRLNTSDATIKNYMDAKRLPVPEMLIEIAKVTGVNLHWLLTGQGPRRVEKAVDLFPDDEEFWLRAGAKRSGRSYEEQLNSIVAAAMEFSRRTS